MNHFIIKRSLQDRLHILTHTLLQGTEFHPSYLQQLTDAWEPVQVSLSQLCSYQWNSSSQKYNFSVVCLYSGPHSDRRSENFVVTSQPLRSSWTLGCGRHNNLSLFWAAETSLGPCCQCQNIVGSFQVSSHSQHNIFVTPAYNALVNTSCAIVLNLTWQMATHVGAAGQPANFDPNLQGWFIIARQGSCGSIWT